MTTPRKINFENLRPKVRIYVAPEVCVTDSTMNLLEEKSAKQYTKSEAPRKMRVRTPWGIEIRTMRYIPLEIHTGFPEELRYVDMVTGTIYHPETGQCSSPQLKLLGEAK